MKPQHDSCHDVDKGGYIPPLIRCTAIQLELNNLTSNTEPIQDDGQDYGWN